MHEKTTDCTADSIDPSLALPLSHSPLHLSPPSSPPSVRFEEISLGAGEERLAVSLLQQPPGFSAASCRFIMDLGTKRVAGIIAQVALLLFSSYGTTGEGERAVRFCTFPGGDGAGPGSADPEGRL